MDNETLDKLAEQLYERFEDRLQRSAKHGRSDKGTGSHGLGSIVRRHRGAFSLRDISASSGLHHGFIGRVEKGERGLSVESLARLTAVFGSDFLIEYITAVYITLYPEWDGRTLATSEPSVPQEPCPAAGRSEVDGRSTFARAMDYGRSNAIRNWNVQQEDALHRKSHIHVSDIRE
jgi:transcriptional regulator with XRE-family HTH domain